ncbi:MAG: ATP phosphoribosyltransferase regulatory subunit [Cyanophyceae cyanobacterium]
MTEGSLSRPAPLPRPPAGVRDLLPLDVLQKKWVEEQLNQVYESWGYQRIITPTLERLETLTAGGSVRPSSVLQLRDAEGTLLGLRPEHTASIVRAVSTRMINAALPLRLYYQDNVFRGAAPGSGQRDQELFQSGVELIGAAGWQADAEMLLLLATSLQRLQIPDWILVVGDMGLTQALLSGLSPAALAPVRQAIVQLDYVALDSDTIPATDRALGQEILNLRGDPETVLARLASLAIPDRHRERIAHLKSLSDMLAQQGIPLVLDLSLLQTYGYYSGIVFQAVAQREVIASGGRYDQLFELYGAGSQAGVPQAGVGFMLPLERLQRILVTSGQMPPLGSRGGLLVVPVDDQAFGAAFQWAQQQRQQDPSARVELELGGRSADELEVLARRRRLDALVWVQADGSHHQTAL